MNIYTEALYRPILNLLVWLYTTIPGADLGLAIIALTVVIRLVLYPLNRQAISSQKALQRLQPEMEALKEKYKNDKEKQGAAMMELYKKEHINPFSSCLPLLIQLPILIAVYGVFRAGLNSDNLNLLDPFVVNPGHLNTLAFGFLDLTHNNIWVAVAAGLGQFWQSKKLMTKRSLSSSGPAAAMNKQMLYIMPAVTVVIGASLPAGLTLYWFCTTAFSILQQWLMFRKVDKTDSK